MAETLFDAMKHSRNPYQTMLLRQIATSDELFGLLPFVPMGGEGFSYEREVSLPSFGFIAPGGSVSESTGTTERVLVTKREATSDFYVDNFAQDNQNDLVDPLERQTKMKLKAAGRTIADKIVNGGAITGFVIEPFDGGPLVDALLSASMFIRDRDEPGEIKYTHADTKVYFRAPGDREFGPGVDISGGDGDYELVSASPSKRIKVTLDVSDAIADAIRRIVFTTSSNEFDGLKKAIPEHRVRKSLSGDTNGATLSFGILEELRDMVKNRSGQLAFVMPAALRRKYNQLCRQLGGTVPQWTQSPHVSVPSFDGIPILVNDFIKLDETKGAKSNLSSIYLLNLGPDDGVYMGCLGGETHDVEADPRDRTVLGFRLRELGQKEGKSQVGRRLSWYGALAFGSDLSVARASEIITD